MTNVLSSTKDGPKTASLIDRLDLGRDLLILRGIEAGRGIKLDLLDADDHPGVSPEKIRISLTAVDPTDAINVGIGHEIYAGKDDEVLRFRKIRGQNGITVAIANDSIVLSGNGGITETSQDPTPQLGGDLDVNGYRIVSGFDDIVIAPAVRTVIGGVAHHPVGSRSLTDGGSGVIATLAATQYGVAYVDYRIVRGTAVRAGTLMVVHNGTAAESSDFGTGIGEVGVVLGASLAGTALTLNYTAAATGTPGTLSYNIRGWAS
jgi:hypothetical protein